MKTYVITAEVKGDNYYLPYRMPDWFDPFEMCYVFRLLDDDGEVLYYGLSNDPSSLDAQDDYGAYGGCTATEYFNPRHNSWDRL